MLDLLPTELWNYSTRDAVLGLRAALFTNRSNGTLSLPEFRDCVSVRSARAGIVVAIGALNLPPGARIGVPLYCCPVVFKAIQAAGCVPRFIDIDPETYCLRVADLAAKSSELEALIAVHMFGNVCDVLRLQEVMPGKPIIEDCAQSVGSKLHGRAAGSFGDIAVFSFRAGKYLSVGEGGGLFSNKPDIRSRLIRLTDAFPYAGRAEECAHVAKSYIRSKLRSRPLYGPVGYPLWQAYNRKVNYAAKSPLVLGRIYRSDFALLPKRLSLLDSAVEKRRSHADFYAKALKLESDTLCAEMPGTFYNRYLFPILLPTIGQRKSLAALLHSREVGTSKPYSDIAGIAAAHYGYQGDCPKAEQVASRVLAIPNHEKLTISDLEKISERLNAAWAGIAR